MSPKVLTPDAEFVAWQEQHRCAICDALPVRMDKTQIEEHRQLKPEYRNLATIGIPAERYHTEYVGSTYRITVVCENGHEFSALDSVWA